MVIHVYQGLGPYTNLSTSLGAFELTGIPQAKKGVPNIEVEFKFSVDGELIV